MYGYNVFSQDGEVTCVRKRCGRAACARRRRGDACCACTRHRRQRAHPHTHPPSWAARAPARLYRSTEGSSTGTTRPLLQLTLASLVTKATALNEFIHSVAEKLGLAFSGALWQLTFQNLLHKIVRLHSVRVRRFRCNASTAPAPTLRLPQTARRLSEWTLRSIDWYIFMYSCDSNVSSVSRWRAAVGRAATESNDGVALLLARLATFYKI